MGRRESLLKYDARYGQVGGACMLVQVRILSLDPEDMMSALAVQMVNAVPESLLFIDSPAADITGKGEDTTGAGGLFLNIGALGQAPIQHPVL